MEELLSLAIIAIIVIVLLPLILSGVALSRSTRAERAATALAGEITALRRRIAELGGERPADAAFAEPSREEPQAAAAEIVSPEPPAGEEIAPMPEAVPEPVAITAQAQPPAESLWQRLARGGLERQFGAVLPVWIGGIALAFAGFFLVKYSIENDLIGPGARVVLGVALGFGLLGGAHFMSTRSAVAESFRIAQSLAGAGIAVLYVAVYAGTALYGLYSPFIGAIGMLAITLGAVILSLRHGPPIALLGMLGGFLTPALIRTGDPSAFTLFTYLFFVFAALMIVIRHRGWWLLALPAVGFAFLWVLIWVFAGPDKPGETVWIGLFLIAVAATIVAATRERYAEEAGAIQTWRQVFSLKNRMLALNTLTVAGALGLMAAVAFDASFSVHDWLLFATLALGAVGLAFFNTPLYGFAPWAAMAVNAVMLFGWHPATTREYATALIGFGALYVVSGLMLFLRSGFPLLWSGLSAAASFGYFLLGYFRLQYAIPVPPPQFIQETSPSTQPVEPLVEVAKETAASLVHVWGGAALAFSALFLAAAFRTARAMPSSADKDRVLATFSLATTAFLAIALSIELKREFLSVAIAAELLAVAWVATRTQIPSLRAIAALLGLGFAYLLLPQLMLLAQLAALAILEARLRFQEIVPIVAWPSFQLALPAVFFLTAAWLFRRDAGGDGLLVRTLEFAALALLGLWGFYTVSAIVHPGENALLVKRSFLERAVMTQVLFAFGTGCLIVARQFGRVAYLQAGVLLVSVAAFRTGFFDILAKSPLVTPGEYVAGWPVFDAIAIAYLFPIAWLWLAAREFALAGSERLARLAGWALSATLVLVFVWLSMEIRRLYHGNILAEGGASDAEFYTYSAAWLVFGLALLFLGTLKGSQMLRYASLAIVLLTVTKVFLLDAGNLTGLYRVFSFLGLGVSLLGLSYFYGRFVFGGPPEPPAGEATQP